MMRRRRIAVIVLLSVLAISVVAIGCGKKSSNYTLPDSTEIEIGTSYKPDFRLSKGTTAEFVSLTVPIGSVAKVADDGSFIPDLTGKYDYTVLFKKKKESWLETVSFTGVDRTAPVFGTLADKDNVETGFYTDIPADIAAAPVTDNCAEKVTVYAKSITFGDVITEIAPDGVGLFLPKVGTYTVTLVAEDYSGNKSEGTYKINTVDTTPAVIEAPKTFIAWLDAEGKVEIPKVNVVEIGDYTLSVEVKKGGAAVAVTNNKFAAEANALYTLTYKAVDRSNNESELDVKLRVNPAGTIADFTDEDEIELWNSETVRSQDGAMYILSEDNTVTLEYFNYFLTKNWSAFKTFETSVFNNRGVELTVKAHIRADGEWKEIAPLEIEGGEIDNNLEFLEPKTATYRFSLADYSLSQVEGIRLMLTCRGGVDAAVDNITLTVDEYSEALPGDAISLKAHGSGKISLENVMPGSDSDNAVKLTLYSSVQTDALIGLKFDALTLYARRMLEAGINNIVRLSTAELSSDIDASISATGLKAIVIENQENYPVTVSVEKVEFANVSDIGISDYAKENKNYGVAYDEKFEVPNPFLADDRYFSGLTVSLSGTPVGKSDAVTINDLTIGSVIYAKGLSENADNNFNELNPGRYTLTYSYFDAFQQLRTITYNLTVAKKLLAVDITDKVFYLEETTMPTPSVSSDKFSSSDLSAVEIKSYYRESGRLSWIELEDGKFNPEFVKWYQFRYVTEYKTNGKTIHIEKFINKFVHKNAYIFDFEEESAATNTITGPSGNMKARYLHDGGYYNPGSFNPVTGKWQNPVYEVYDDWHVSGSHSAYCYTTVDGWMGWNVAPAIQNDIDIIAVRFWLRAERGGPSQLSLFNGGVALFDEFEVYAGAHEYLIFLKTPEKLKQITWVIFRMYANYRFAVDDFELLGLQYDGSIPETGLTNQNIVLPYATFGGDVQAEISYRKQGTNDWTKLNGNILNVSEGGNYELRYDFGGLYEETFEIYIDKYILRVSENYTEIKSATVGDTVSLQLPQLSITVDGAPYSDPLTWTVRYKKDDDNEWTKLEQDSLSFVVNTANIYYDVEFVASFTVQGDEETYTVYDTIYVRGAADADVIDFERENGKDTNRGESDSAYPGSLVKVGTTDGVMIDDEHAKSGRYSMRINTLANRFVGFGEMNVSVTSGTYCAIKFWAYSNEAVSGGYFAIATEKAGRFVDTSTDTFSLPAGVWTQITVKFASIQEMDDIYAIIYCGSVSNKAIWFDDFELVAQSVYDSAKIPTHAFVGEAIMLPTATYGDGQSATISYREEDAEDWIPISDNMVTFENKETYYEVKYDFSATEDIYRIYVIDKGDVVIDFEDLQTDDKGHEYFKVGDNRVYPNAGGLTPDDTDYEKYKITSQFEDTYKNHWLVFMPNGTVSWDGIRLRNEAYNDVTASIKSTRYIRFSAYSPIAKSGVTFWLYPSPSRGMECIVDIPAGYSEITIQYTETFNTLQRFNLSTSAVPSGFRIDNIRIYESVIPEVKYSSAVPTHAWKDEQTELPTATYAEEKATIYYRIKDGDGNWMQADGNKATFTQDETYYEVKYEFVSTDDEIREIYVIDKENIIVDFEKNAVDGKGVTADYAVEVEGKTYYCYDYAGGIAPNDSSYAGWRRTEIANIDGSNWFTWKSTGEGWSGLYFRDPDNSYNRTYLPIGMMTKHVRFSCYSPASTTITIPGNSGSTGFTGSTNMGTSESQTNQQLIIQPGYSEIDIYLKDDGVSSFNRFTFYNRGDLLPVGFRIDNIRIVK